MRAPRLVDDAILVDEVGIEFGRYGDFILKSAYQPVYRREGEYLVPFAVEGLIVPLLEGRAVPPWRLFESVPAEDRVFVETMCRVLHLRNYHNIGVSGLQLFFNFDPGVHQDLDLAVAQIRLMAKRLAEMDFDSDLLICEVTEKALGSDVLIQLAAEMRRNGIRLAIDDFGTGDSNLERVDLLEPDIVKIDGHWFRRVSEVAETARLLPPLIAGFRARGAEVLVEGVETAWQLRIALDAGAELFQGFLLGRPALAGTIFDEKPLSIEELIRVPENVVLLRR